MMKVDETRRQNSGGCSPCRAAELGKHIDLAAHQELRPLGSSRAIALPVHSLSEFLAAAAFIPLIHAVIMSTAG